MNLFRRRRQLKVLHEAPRAGVRHELRREAFDHDCFPAHDDQCQPVDVAVVVAWSTQDGRQLTEGPEFDALEARYQGGSL